MINRGIFGTITKVHDGNTAMIDISGPKAIPIRLSGIDAPELKQEFGKDSKESLESLILGRYVRLRVESVDKYGYTVATIFTIGGTSTSIRQVRNGMAWVYRKYNNNPSLIRAETRARARKSGIWSSSDLIPPWEFRRREKGKTISTGER